MGHLRPAVSGLLTNVTVIRGDILCVFSLLLCLLLYSVSVFCLRFLCLLMLPVLPESHRLRRPRHPLMLHLILLLTAFR